MVFLGTNASIECDYPECNAKSPGRVALTMAGTLSIKPSSGEWQFGASQQGLMMCRCPKHVIKVDDEPVIRRAANLDAVNGAANGALSLVKT